MAGERHIALLFPGQGSQQVGMGRSWAERHPEARATFEEADEVLGFALSRLCWEGPAEELQLTANQQPAILAVSTAMHRVLRARGIAAHMVAGHSLGEYSALVAAGVLELADALRLVRRRGELMQEAVPVGVGAMAAIVGMPAPEVEEVVAAAAEDEVCAVANLNSLEQTVIAGHTAAVERAMALATGRGAKRALRLPVSAPFHSPLMRPAREGLEPLLRETRFRDPACPVVVNVDAVGVTSGEAAREALIRQVDSPVRWVESVQWITHGGTAATFCEVGPGNVLAGLVRRILPGERPLTMGEPDGLEALVEALGH